MPRMPSVRRTVIKAMEENSRRIREKQKASPEYLLSEEERAALVDAAKVGHLLNKVDTGGKPHGGKPVKDPEAVIADLEKEGPPKVSRAADAEDEET